MNDSALGKIPGVAPGAPPGGIDKGSVLSRLLQAPVQGLRTALNDVVTTLYPSDCRVCNRPLLELSLHPVCISCIASIPQQSLPTCARCGEALDLESATFGRQFDEGRLCSPCRMVPPPFERAVAHAVYRDDLREMIHLLKYEQMRSLAGPLGRVLAQTIQALEPEIGTDLLVIAVPLFPSKVRERGYNQAALLADSAVAELRRLRPGWTLKPAHPLLRRVRDTQSQFELTSRARRRNLQGAFAVPDSEAVRGREVLLIDDIYTSGATARACSSALRRAGAAKVWVATLSRAQSETVALWGSSSNTAAWDAG